MVASAVGSVKIHANIHFDNINRSYKPLATIEEAFRANFFQVSLLWRVDFRYPNQLVEP